MLSMGHKKTNRHQKFSPRALLVLAHVMKRITMVTSKSVRMADSVANSFHFHANPTPAEPKNKKFKIHFSNLPIIIYDFFFGRREPPLLYYHVVYPYINPPLISFVFISTFRLSNSGGVDGRYRTSGDSA